MHFYFSHCGSTSHTPVLRLPGWGLQLPVITSMHPHFLKPGAPCSGLWNGHGEHPLHEQPGGIHCPCSFSAFSHMLVGNTSPPTWSLASKAAKARGVLWLLAAKRQYEIDVFRVIPLKSYLSFLTMYIILQYLKRKRFLSGKVENNYQKKKKTSHSLP